MLDRYLNDICSVAVRTSTVLSATCLWASATLTPPFSTNACEYFWYFWLMCFFFIFVNIFGALRWVCFKIREHNCLAPVQIKKIRTVIYESYSCDIFFPDCIFLSFLEKTCLSFWSQSHVTKINNTEFRIYRSILICYYIPVRICM